MTEIKMRNFKNIVLSTIGVAAVIMLAGCSSSGDATKPDAPGAGAANKPDAGPPPTGTSSAMQKGQKANIDPTK
jgi:uncharacterized lipoprotein